MVKEADELANEHPVGRRAQAAPGSGPSSTEVLAATIAAAVERQLTQYVSAMSKQVEAARQSADGAKAELRSEFAQQLEAIVSRLDAQQQSNDQYQKALQGALEQRLAEFANHQHVRLTELDTKIGAVPAQIHATLPAQVSAANEGLRQYVEQQHDTMHAQIEDARNVSRRIDEQASALVQHVNESTAALTRRMDEGDEHLALAIEERLSGVRTALDDVTTDVQRQLVEQTNAVAQRIDNGDIKVTDRMLAMEERINEQAGTKIAGLEATIGRIGAGFDDAMGALSQRLLVSENALGEAHERMDALSEQVAKVDENAINEVKEQLSSAIGEAMLVRIELDRVVAAMDEKLDKTAVRMAEIEGQLADEMDVSTAVQLERLEEIERALVELDPEQFVRKSEIGAGPTSSPAGFPSSSLNTGPTSTTSPTPNTDDGTTTTSEPSYTSH